MALSGNLLGTLIQTNLASKNFTGSQIANLSNAIGIGIINEILLSNRYEGKASGTGAGSGTGTGTVLGIVGADVATSIYKNMGDRDLKGTKALDLAIGIGDAFATHILSGIVNSVSAPVGIGAGVGKIKGIVGTAVGSQISTMMTSFNLTGTSSPNLAMAIGEAIASAFLTAQVTTVIVGTVSYPPVPTSGGEDIGKLS
jgi:hypothetical protein